MCDTLCVISSVRKLVDRLRFGYMDKISEPKNRGAGKNIFWNLDIFVDIIFHGFGVRVSETPDGKIDRHLRSQSAFLWDGENL